MKLPALDLLIILLYFLLVLGIGFWFARRSAQSLEAYFLGGKSMPWWALGLSGSVSNFDITGTMWLCSLFFLLGMKAFWVFWMFAFLMGAFLMSYLAAWVRRTNVMTMAELMKVRFGEEAPGRAARRVAALIVVTFMTFAIGYAFKGIGKFASEYLPLSPGLCAILIMGLTTIYVVIGGFRSVIVTDVLQALILNVGGLIVAIMAYFAVNPEIIHQKFSPSLLPVWEIPELAGTDHQSYQWFGAMCFVWVLGGLLISMGTAGGPYGEQRFLASRNPRDAAKAGAGWSLFLVIRWAMVAGLTMLAISGLEGVQDPESVLPKVIQVFLPQGLRGLILAGLLAAFMSTFSSTLNAMSSIVVRDLIQPLWKNATQRQLVRCSYTATLLIVVTGIGLGTRFDSIDAIWKWMLIGLNASMVLPNFLRWYWWRMNGWGYAAGTLAGMILSLVVLFFPQTPELVYGPAVHLVALIGCVAGSLLTPAVDGPTLAEFYRRVRPLGFWGPVKRLGGTSQSSEADRSRATRITFNVILGMTAFFCLNLFAVYIVGHWHLYAAMSLGIALAASFVLYFSWYKRLPEE